MILLMKALPMLLTDSLWHVIGQLLRLPGIPELLNVLSVIKQVLVPRSKSAMAVLMTHIRTQHSVA